MNYSDPINYSILATVYFDRDSGTAAEESLIINKRYQSYFKYDVNNSQPCTWESIGY